MRAVFAVQHFGTPFPGSRVIPSCHTAKVAQVGDVHHLLFGVDDGCEGASADVFGKAADDLTGARVWQDFVLVNWAGRKRAGDVESRLQDIGIKSDKTIVSTASI